MFHKIILASPKGWFAQMAKLQVLDPDELIVKHGLLTSVPSSLGV